MEGWECERKSMKNQFKNRKFRDKHFVAVVHMTITIRSSRNRIINLTFRLIFKLTKVSFFRFSISYELLFFRQFYKEVTLYMPRRYEFVG